MMPPAPPEVQAMLNAIPWQLTALQFFTPLFVGVLLIWWKLHSIAKTYDLTTAELVESIKRGEVPATPTRPRRRFPLPADAMEIVLTDEGWYAGSAVQPINYRDDTGQQNAEAKV
jgi:hypothetical protein